MKKYFIIINLILGLLSSALMAQEPLESKPQNQKDSRF